MFFLICRCIFYTEYYQVCVKSSVRLINFTSSSITTIMYKLITFFVLAYLFVSCSSSSNEKEGLEGSRPNIILVMTRPMWLRVVTGMIR